jgi:hypothetical protein
VVRNKEQSAADVLVGAMECEIEDRMRRLKSLRRDVTDLEESIQDIKDRIWKLRLTR